MRILMIIDGLPGGGAEKVVLTLCQGMQQQGHDVSLISLRDVCNYPIPPGIDYQVVADRSRAPWRKLTELSRRAAALDRAIAEHERQHGAFDLVFSNLHKTDRIVSRSKRLASDRLWFCIHGILSTSYLGHRKGLDRWLKQRKIANVYQGEISSPFHRRSAAICSRICRSARVGWRSSITRSTSTPSGNRRRRLANWPVRTIWCTSAAFTPPSGMTAC